MQEYVKYPEPNIVIYSDMFFKHDTINIVGSSNTIFYRLISYLLEKMKKNKKKKKICFPIWFPFIQCIYTLVFTHQQYNISKC